MIAERIASQIRHRLRALFRRDAIEQEMDEELALHLEMETEANLRRGMSPEAAHRQAVLAFGGVEGTKEAVRDSRGVRPLEDVARDVRFACRSFGRAPGFTITAVLVLALGIGATTSIFSAVRAVVLRPLPFAEPEHLYMLWQSNPEMGGARQMASRANYLDWKERVAAFADVEAYGSPWQVPVTGLERPVALRAVNVTGGLFSMLGVRPMLGRDFTEAETWASATWRAGETPLLLSADTWRTVFGGDESVIGRSVGFNGGEARVVGVMPEGFAFPEEGIQLWIPTGWPDEARDAAWFRRSQSIWPVARLTDGVPPEQAAAELDAVTAQLEREHPELDGLMAAGMSPLQDFLLGDTRTPLLILLGAVGLMLLIACANVGNLLLVRASARRRALAVRAALGASRGRLVRQMLTESVVLAALGGAGGIFLGVAGTGLLERLQPAGLLRVTSFPVDGGVIAFAVAVTAGAAILFGTFPAFLARRAGPGEALREAGRSGGAGREARRVVSGLVVAEVALAALLVLGAGLLVRSITELRQVDPGFDPEGVVAITLNVPGARYPRPEHVIPFYEEVLARVRALPGVASAAASSTLPLRNRGYTSDFFIAGRAADEYGTEVLRRSVTPGYFETMGVPLLAGRRLTEADAWIGDPAAATRSGWSGVALINEAMARQYFPGEDPVGQRITLTRSPDSTSAWRTIVGVVGSERQSAIATPPQIELIEPFAQNPERDMYLYVRVARGDPIRIVPAVRSIIHDLDPALPLFGAVAMEDLVADSMARDRFLMLLLLGFAAVAVVLALVGVYGVTAQAARQRLPELGLRKALGAHDRDIVWLTLRRGLALVAMGVALGVSVALVATRALAGMLYGVTANDPATFAVVAVFLTTAGLAASWLPARRAARVDPADTLRAE
jgi:putative ABC transport system permease protein